MFISGRIRISQGHRRGSLLVEVAVSAALLGALLIIINQMVVRLHKQAAALDDHRFAQQTLENLLEEFTAKPWDQLATDSVTELSVPALAEKKLHQLALSGEVVEEQEPVAAKRIRLQLSWESDTGIERSLQLATWAFPAPEVEE